MCRRVGCLGCRPDAANRLRTRGGTVSVRRFGTNGSCVLCDRIDTPYVVLRGYRTGLRPRLPCRGRRNGLDVELDGVHAARAGTAGALGGAV